MPKPFRGHIGMIQRNAIRSWILLRPTCDIVLLGDEEGTAETAREFGLHHIPFVARNEYGTPLINSIFEQAQAVSKHRLLAYVNADIILFNDFLSSARRIPFRRFLMVGQRWDLRLEEPLNFSDPDWERKLRDRVRSEGILLNRSGIDYFAFTAGLWNEIPPFAIGRTAWDTWLIYGARARGAAVVDASDAVTIVHQNHDYSHVTDNVTGTAEMAWHGPEAVRNVNLAGGDTSRFFNIDDATWELPERGFVRPVLSVERLMRHSRRLSTLPLPTWRFLLMREVFSLLLACYGKRLTKHLLQRAQRVFSLCLKQ